MLSLRFVLATWGMNTVQTACGLGTHYHGEIYGLSMHESFSVHQHLCFVMPFVLRVPELDEGVMFGGKALG